MKQENIDIKKLAINMGQVPGLPKNPRLIKDKRYQALIKSLIEDPEMLDLREIIAYDNQGSLVVICGNMRVRAAREIGMKTLPVKILPPETPIEKLKAYLIKDNVSFGSDDWGLLMTDWDRGDLETWGLDTPDRWTKKTEAEEDDHDIDADLKTDIKIGDLFQIGPHRLLCGDSTRSDDFAKLMGEEKADLIFTDPPYGVSYTGVDNPGGVPWAMILNDDLRGDALIKFLAAAFINGFNFTKPGITGYCWYASRTHIQFEQAIAAAGFEIKQQLIWNKGMTLSRSDYHWAHEPVLYIKKKGQESEWYGDRTHKTILGMKRSEIDLLTKETLLKMVKTLMETSTNWELDREKIVNYKHPTQKPVTLAGRAMTNSSQAGQIVLDFFLGSGGTMVAAHQLERKCYGMDLEPKWCQVTIDRMRHLDPGIQITKL